MKIEIELLRRQIEAGERQVQRHRESIDRARARGSPSDAAEELLADLERAVRVNRLRLRRMLGDQGERPVHDRWLTASA